MSRRPIRVLPEALVGRIAAGEVVERPSSVVKELLENALDAGAASVRVEVEGELTRILRVSDDGGGIPYEELAVAVERHATSKIQDPDDLDRIDSLGFRGEGLAAIGAVSRLRLLSRSESAESGAEVLVEGGSAGPVRPAARARGTTVEVRDLFFNTPARRKHLKSSPSELRHVSQLLQAYALARPDVRFTLSVNGQDTLNLPPAGDLHARLQQILGRERVARMIPVLEESPGLGLEGFLGAPEDSRTRIAHQTFLVNGRWVASVLLRTAVREAYGDLIPPGRHPEAVLHLTLPPEDVDVNVHPTKREVRIVRERELYPRLIRLLRRRVEERFPSFQFRGIQEPTAGPPREAPLRIPFGYERPAERIGEAPIIPFPGPAPLEAPETDDVPAMASMWQFQNMYIMAALQGALLIVDQHAAHERVLYEQALRRLRGESAPAQELLFPVVVELAPDEYSVLLEVYGVLERLGFHLEQFGGNTVLVHGIPPGLREWRHGALLRDVLDHFAELPTKLDVTERVARSVACHGAVKAGQKLSLSEMNGLVDQLFATEKPQGDPHGRPVFLRIDLQELHRRFGRSG